MIVTFDIETAEEASDDNRRPLGVTCAATFLVNDKETEPPYRPEDGEPRLWHSDYQAQMSPADMTKMIHYLAQLQGEGVNVVAWNSVGFDFRILALELPEMQMEIRSLALGSIDPAFSMLCSRGYMIGLNTAAIGLGIEGKMEGMDGLEAISAWQESRARQDLVLRYVGQDAIVTANVWAMASRRRGLPWTSLSGRRNRFRFSEVVGMTVEESRRTRVPNTSWMTDPRSRESVDGWLDAGRWWEKGGGA